MATVFPINPYPFQPTNVVDLGSISGSVAATSIPAQWLKAFVTIPRDEGLSGPNASGVFIRGLCWIHRVILKTDFAVPTTKDFYTPATGLTAILLPGSRKLVIFDSITFRDPEGGHSLHHCLCAEITPAP